MNKPRITEQLLQAIWCCQNALSLKDEPFFAENESILKENLEQAGKAFSGSWLGYHANIYYRNLETPKPGDRFNSEWGFSSGYFDYSSENWGECTRDSLRDAMLSGVDPTYESKLSSLSIQARAVLVEHLDAIRVIVEVLIQDNETQTLQRIHDDLNSIEPDMSASKIVIAMRPGNFFTRDSSAISQGVINPVHIILLAEQIEKRHPFHALDKLIECCNRVRKFMEIHDLLEIPAMSAGRKVFIGHGRSPLWRELKDFLKDHLSLEWDEFNRTPTAGITTVERLEEMLNNSAFAFLVMTAEDEHDDKQRHARQNVVHEVGLFQGHIGFRRAIVLLEDGCSEFSNIVGLSQIRFPSGNIGACFEDIRRVLNREGIL